MKKAYTYVVLFATLMMTIGGSVGVFMALADIVAPVSYHTTFDEYKRWDIPVGESVEELEDVRSEEQLREDYDSMIIDEVARDKERSMNLLIKSFGWIIIPLPIFIYFKRRFDKD